MSGNRTQGAVQTLGTITNWAGAAVSLALIVGIGVWGYKMLARDVSGVPVVRAASGKPMRVQPEDPGGSPAMHQGLAVNRVAADGTAEKPADRLVLAPAPVTLSDDDQPSGAVQLVAGAESRQAETMTPAAVEAPQMASIRALADQLASGAVPLEESDSAADTVELAAVEAPSVPAEPVVEAESGAVVKAVAKPEVKGGIKRSLRPMLRPGGLKQASVAAAAAPEVTSVEVEAEMVPAGTKVAQLGAFDSAETARKEWDKLETRFGDYLEGKQRVIQKAQSGGRVFYRLRAMGFADLSDARRFCSALVAERADCIPVTTK